MPSLLAALAAAWTVVWQFGLEASPARRYEALATYRFDLGNMTQAVWNTAHGRPLEVTLASGEQASRLGVHVDPILAVFAPLWWIFPSPLLLLVVQAGALASAAYPVLKLAEARLGSRLAGAFLGGAYLFYPWVIWQAYSDDLHPVTLALPLLLWALWFAEIGRMGAFAVALAGALACGELVGLAVAGLGMWYALSQGRRRLGAVVTAVGLAWTALCLWVIIPAYSQQESGFYDRFESVGGSPGGLARTIVTDPATIVEQATSAGDLAYAAALIAPLAGFVVWAPLALLGAVPQLGLNLLSDWNATTSPQAHYVSVIVPFLFLATIYGLARFVTVRRRVVGAAAVLTTCLLTWFAFAPWPGLLLSSRSDRLTAPYLEQSRRPAVREALALVPDDAAVSATNRVAGRLSERRYVYSAPVLGRATWAVVDTTDPWIPQLGDAREGADPGRLARHLTRLERDTAWRRVFHRDDVSVFVRRGANG